MSDAIKTSLFSLRCVDKVIHNKDGKAAYMTVGNDYEKFSRNVDKVRVDVACGTPGNWSCWVTILSTRNRQRRERCVAGRIHAYDLVDLSATRLTLLEGGSDYLLRRALILGEENPMSHVAALVDGDTELRESILAFLSRLKVASTVSIKDGDAPNGWR